MSGASDHEQITGLIARYCPIVDREPAAVIADLFWDDAVLEFNGTHEGRAAIVAAYEDWIAKMREPVDELRHLIYQPAITVDGGRASAETYFDADAVTRKSRRLVELRGVYRDALERRDGVWRFARREIVGMTPKPRRGVAEGENRG